MVMASLSIPVGAAHAQWITPGPLAAGHRELDDTTACEKCHAPGKRVEADRCLACHKEVAVPLAAGRGYHATLVKSANRRCETCHSDHKGRDYPLIRWTPPATFDHGKDTGFALTGSHTTTTCANCHKDRPRYMGAATTCVGCHEDNHRGELGTKCESCHDTNTFEPARLFDHKKTSFPLENRHTEVACVGCHKPNASGQVSYDVKSFDRCSSCHGDPHQGKTALSPCTDCHTTEGWQNVQAVPPAHSPAGWPLVGKHVGVSCADCHGSNLAAKVSKSCASCHQDAHQGRLGKDCESCHNEGGWRQVNTTSFNHARTRYPLEGRHEEVTCEKCHKKSAGRTLWRGVAFDRCERCHTDWHGEAAGALVTAPSSASCESCHTTRGFDPSTFTTKEHAIARFVLEGSHLAAPCETCHVSGQGVAVASSPTSGPATRPKTRPGKTPALEATPLAIGVKACAGCHQDPHNGQFDMTMVNGKSCDACHSTAGWSQGSFDHDQTAMPLRGIHALAACGSCHKGDPVQYKGLATRCAGCHQDEHQGQFLTASFAGSAASTGPTPLVASPKLTANPRSCEGCHSQETFEIKPFDHFSTTGFELKGKHRPLGCEGCHNERTLAGGDTVVQYRLGYDNCEDCHANPHQSGANSTGGARHPDVPNFGTGGTGCSNCHTDTDWQDITSKVSFDHALTGFRLDGEHKQATCDSCHGRPLRTDETRAACATCHEDPHRGEQGDNCESCHDARRWEPSNALLKHRGTRFPLVGMHAAADCTSCHDRTREDTWRATPSDCYSCHTKEYQRTDIHPNHVTAGFDRACDTCHSQATWFPARLRHDNFWPLRGAHATTDCFQCHEGERYGGTPTTCIDCHRDDYVTAADPAHAAFGMSTRCESCHTETTWEQVRSNWHESRFPIARGEHSGLECKDCHFEGLPPQNFTCIGCHGRSDTDRHHGGVGGYVWENFACFACHPSGGD